MGIDLEQIGFPPFHQVRSRFSIADLYPNKGRCGIYILKFETGELYVGQAVDVARRFVQHQKTHADIVGISFRVAVKGSLNTLERRTIEFLEFNGALLRNITFVSVVQGESDLDSLLTEEEQREFLSGLLTNDSLARVQDTDLRRRYHPKFLRLQKHDVYLDFLDVFKTYICRCLPSPTKTELSFWAVSCLPSGSRKPEILSRVNLNMQEVLTAFCDDDGLAFTFHIARSPLEQAFGAVWQETLEASGVEVSEHRYAPGGQDQISVCCDQRQASHLLEVPAFLHAARCFNLRLMRKGPTKYNRYHCFALADELLG